MNEKITTFFIQNNKNMLRKIYIYIDNTIILIQIVPN